MAHVAVAEIDIRVHIRIESSNTVDKLCKKSIPPVYPKAVNEVLYFGKNFSSAENKPPPTFRWKEGRKEMEHFSITYIIVHRVPKGQIHARNGVVP